MLPSLGPSTRATRNALPAVLPLLIPLAACYMGLLFLSHLRGRKVCSLYNTPFSELENVVFTAGRLPFSPKARCLPVGEGVNVAFFRDPEN